MEEGKERNKFKGKKTWWRKNTKVVQQKEKTEV